MRGHSKELLEWMEQNFWNMFVTVTLMIMDARDLKKQEEIKKHFRKVAEEKAKNSTEQ